MFLLSKLDESSRLFPDDVEGTREFLLDRGIPAGSLDALTHFSARLAIDPSFRRDVTSLVQVVIRRENEAVDYMDLLGILVAAAAGAGPFNANDEQEESVREILRFLTQIRRPTGAVGPVFVRSQNVVPLVVATEPLTGDRPSQPVRGGYDVAVRPVPSVPFSQVEESEPSRWRGAAVWVVGVTALAVALGSGWIHYQKNRATPQTTAALQIVPSSSLPVNDEKDDLAMAPAGRVRKSQPLVTRKASPAVARHLKSFRTPPAESAITEPATPVRPLRPLNADQSFPSVNSTSPAKSDVIAESNPVPRPLNAAPESTAKSTAPLNTATTSAPSVRRRLPKSVVINPGPLRRPGGSSESLNVSAPGVVHPASIGMMASNLISSPAPPYPAAASQARVQGEVTVRAVVDREGNVTDARVVSGPELLRDVSLEAVQHWHYRPYMQGGKPVEAATTAVLDFELP
jgi:TonB family protein